MTLFSDQAHGWDQPMVRSHVDFACRTLRKDHVWIESQIKTCSLGLKLKTLPQHPRWLLHSLQVFSISSLVLGVSFPSFPVCV